MENVNLSTGLAQGQPLPRVSPAYPKRAVGRRDIRLALFLLLFSCLLCDCLIWAGGLGIGEALTLVGLFCSAAMYLRLAGKQRTGYGSVCAILYLAGAVSLVFSGDITLKLMTLFLLTLLFLLYVIERMGLRTGTGLRARFTDLCSAAFSISLGRLPESCWALFRGNSSDRAHKRMTGVLLGLACAVPALLLVIPLLISSDAAFEGLMGRLDVDAVVRGTLALAFGAGLALLIFTLLFTANRPGKAARGSGFGGLDPVMVITFLAVLCFAYLLYLAAQFAYFTDAFRGLLPKDFTVAQYARRGFFEMCAIVAINLGVIIFATRLCRKNEGRLPGAVKALALFLCLFSLGLVATSLSKMVLYMGSLGLTRLRVLTSVFMLWLAVLLVAVGIKLFTKRLPVLQLAVVTGAAILIALSLANVDGIVARYNVNAYRTGKLDSLDADTVCWLDDGAVPALVKLLDDPDPEIAEKARTELQARLAFHGLATRTPDSIEPADRPDDLRSWNLIGQQARTVLAENRDRILGE